MSEYERPDRAQREPTLEDVRELMGASTPHFSLQISARIRNLVGGLPPDHPARIEGEREIRRLEALADGSENRGPIQPHEEERALPSYRGERPLPAAESG